MTINRVPTRLINIRATPADERNIKTIIRQGYAANTTAAIRTALAHLAQRNGTR